MALRPDSWAERSPRYGREASQDEIVEIDGFRDAGTAASTVLVEVCDEPEVVARPSFRAAMLSNALIEARPGMSSTSRNISQAMSTTGSVIVLIPRKVIVARLARGWIMSVQRRTLPMTMGIPTKSESAAPMMITASVICKA
jgi:hypothetical protein